MIFTVDVGNTNIVLAVYKNDKILFSSRIATQHYQTADEYAVLFMGILNLNNCPADNFEGAIISTVVPQLKPVLKSALIKLLKCPVMIVSCNMKTDFEILTDNPSVTGADLICGAAGARLKYPYPAIIFDLGTATTIVAIDHKGNYLGGSIIPGVNVSLKTLANSAAQLSHINLDEPCTELIGKNTINAMRSGSIIGTACMMDGMIERYKEIIGKDAVVIATGGLSGLIVPHCRNAVIYDKDLISDGLYYLYNLNK